MAKEDSMQHAGGEGIWSMWGAGGKTYYRLVFWYQWSPLRDLGSQVTCVHTSKWSIVLQVQGEEQVGGGWRQGGWRNQGECFKLSREGIVPKLGSKENGVRDQEISETVAEIFWKEGWHRTKTTQASVFSGKSGRWVIGDQSGWAFGGSGLWLRPLLIITKKWKNIYKFCWAQVPEPTNNKHYLI